MRIVRYDAEGRATSVALESASASRGSADGFVVVEDPTPAELDEVRRAFGLGVATSKVSRSRSHPALAVVDGGLRVEVGTACYDDDAEAVELGGITLWAGEGLAVLVRRGTASAAIDLGAALAHRPQLARHGAVAVIPALLGEIVDAYVPVTEGIDSDIGELEEEVFSPDRRSVAERIYRLKGEVLGFHRAILALAAVLDQLLEHEQLALDDAIRLRLAAVRDHLDRVQDRVAAQREMLTSVLEAHLAQLSVRQNDDMRRITAWVAIAAVPTAIAAIYGMNFSHMPELGWRYGYPAVLVVMAVACVALYRLFRRSGWL